MFEKLNPDALADFDEDLPGAQAVTRKMIQDYITTSSALPHESAVPFAEWANETWNEYDDGSGAQTNGQIVAGMLAYWRGQ